MTLHRRLAAASGVISIVVLTSGTNAVVAYATPHNGNGNGGSSSSSGGKSGSSSNSSGGSSSGSSSAGSSSSSSSDSSGSTASGSSAGTGGSPSTGAPAGSGVNLPNLFKSIPGQINQTINQVTGAFTSVFPGGAAQSSTNSPNIGKGSPSPTAKNNKPKKPAAGAVPSTAAAPSAVPDLTSISTDDTDDNTPAKPAKISLPNMVADVPLTALDALKTTIPVIAAAIPLPGIAALPAIANAVIIPLEKAVTTLANVANGLPFMQVDPTQILTTTQAMTNRYEHLVPLAGGLAPKAAGPNPQLGGNIALDAKLPIKAPIEPAKLDQIFSASTHLEAKQEYRPGYPDYLRAAGLSEVAAVAVPGFAGILTITAAGGLLGYRQARAGHATTPSRAARFVH